MPAPNYEHGLAPCPGCDIELVAPFSAAGRTVRCKSCGTRFTLPSQQDLFESAIAYLLEHDSELAESSEAAAFDDAAEHIRQETMVREPADANAQVAWLG